jgi:hypothetical protein
MPNIPQQQRDPFAAMQPIQPQNAFELNMRVYDPDVFNRANAYIAAHQNEAAADDAVPGVANVVQIVPDEYDALAMATAGRYVLQYADRNNNINNNYINNYNNNIIGGRRARRSRGQRSRGRSLSRRHRKSKRQRSSRK